MHERFRDLINELDAFLRRHSQKPMKLYYFAYPYSNAPKENSLKVGEIVKKILEHRKDIVPLVPHFTFDAMYDFPSGYSHPEMAHWEVEIISRCDAVVYDPEVCKGKYTGGVIWEVALAQKLGLPIWTYDEIRQSMDVL